MDNLSEQQRILLAVVLSVGILLGWQFFFPPPPPAEPPAETPTDAPATPEPSEPEAPVQPAEPEADGEYPLTDEPAPVVEAPTVSRASRGFETDVLEGRFSNLDGRFERLALKDYSEQAEGDDGAKQPVNLVASEGAAHESQAALRFELVEREAPPLDFSADSGLDLGGKNEGADIAVSVKLEGYAIRYRLSVTNTAAQPLSGAAIYHMGLRQTSGGRSMFAPAADVVSGLCYYEGGVDRDLVSDLVEEPVNAAAEVEWAGIDRQYFVVAAVPVGDMERSCTMSAVEDTAVVELRLPFSGVAAGSRWEQEVVVFAGPKRIDALEAVDPLLGEAIEYNLWGIPLGFFARPMVWLLSLFHGWTGNWGFAIILLTFFVKAGLFPVTYRSAVSMRKMQQLRPEIEKLKKQYENDRERQQMEQMKLFREQGVNPLGGCLPLFLQMPIWFALYRALWTSVDLYQQPFLWVADLTAAEPFPVLALVVGGLTFLQQRLQPMAVDNQQMKMMMYVMPVMFTFFMFALPSGLVLYILVNSALTIIQQLVINRQR